MKNQDKPVTRLQAFYAMSKLLMKYSETSKCEFLMFLAGLFTIYEDGVTSDPCAWYDWEECLNEGIEGKFVNADPKIVNGKPAQIDEKYYEAYRRVGGPVVRTYKAPPPDENS